MDFSIPNNQQRDLLNEVNALLILPSISYLLLLGLQSVGSGMYTQYTHDDMETAALQTELRQLHVARNNSRLLLRA